MDTGKDYDVRTRVSFKLDFDGSGELNLLALPDVQRTFAGHRVCLDAGSYEALGRRHLINDTAMPMDAMAFADLEAAGRQYEDRHPAAPLPTKAEKRFCGAPRFCAPFPGKRPRKRRTS